MEEVRGSIPLSSTSRQRDRLDARVPVRSGARVAERYEYLGGVTRIARLGSLAATQVLRWF